MKFKYKARKPDGSEQTGSVRAETREQAMALLRDQQLEPFSVEEQGSAFEFTEKLNALLNRVGTKDLAIFSRQLAVLIESRVPIVRALKTIGEQAENISIKNVCKIMTKDVQEGKSLSEAMEKHQNIFNNFFISVVSSGEASGDLTKALTYLADNIERNYELQQKIKGAMTYPVVILLAFIGIFFFLSVKVLPQLTQIFKETDMELPMTTEIIIVISDFMKVNWVLVLIATILIIVGIYFYFTKTDIGKRSFDNFVLKIPVIGDLVKYSYITRFAENFGVLIGQGVSIVKSLKIMAQIMDNVVYQNIMVKIMENVEKGESMTIAMYEEEEAFPTMVASMVKIGEETGRVAQILKNIERFYSREVKTMTDSMSSIIEPFLILFMGVGTAILVAAIIMPIYNMAGAV
jgi:type IV pilus assembly protein PilC